VYDITRKETFEHLNQWVEDLKNYSHPNITIMLIGNKSDLHERRQVSTTEATKFAEEHNMMFLETSAKTAENVEDAFLKTADSIFDKIKSGVFDYVTETYGIKVGRKEEPQEDGCSC